MILAIRLIIAVSSYTFSFHFMFPILKYGEQFVPVYLVTWIALTCNTILTRCSTALRRWSSFSLKKQLFKLIFKLFLTLTLTSCYFFYFDFDCPTLEADDWYYFGHFYIEYFGIGSHIHPQSSKIKMNFKPEGINERSFTSAQ